MLCTITFIKTFTFTMMRHENYLQRFLLMRHQANSPVAAVSEHGATYQTLETVFAVLVLVI